MDPLVLIFGSLLSGLIGWMIGQSRGRPLMGVLLGLLLGPIGWVISAFNDQRPVCPECQGRCPQGARRCQHCGIVFPAPIQHLEAVATGEAWRQNRDAKDWQQTVAEGDEIAKWAKESPTSTEIHFECPKCAQRMSGHEVLQFNEVECPGCGEKFIPRPKNPA